MIGTSAKTASTIPLGEAHVGFRGHASDAAELRASQREADRILRAEVMSSVERDRGTALADSVLLHPVAGLSPAPWARGLKDRPPGGPTTSPPGRTG